ncbi:MAG: sigma-70 family RNA polymerase sigma factor [Pirellulales bacterium]|nr:sigma-70 family RNA polymerase sigma factor [Pirellulales bacterium]
MTTPAPDTRASLILRLPDTADHAAWREFAEIYEPLICRLARGRGLQEADTRDLVQDVFLAVSRSIGRWDPAKERGRFRDWLFTIARNQLLKVLTRRKYRPWSAGGSDLTPLFDNQPAPESNLSTDLDQELQRQIFAWAADKVRHQVHEKTWRAFALTSLDNLTCAAAAAELDMTTGAVHIARCRVLGRLRELVANTTIPHDH